MAECLPSILKALGSIKKEEEEKKAGEEIIGRQNMLYDTCSEEISVPLWRECGGEKRL